MKVVVEGVGLLGPGLANWEHGRAMLAGHCDYVEGPLTLPAAELLPRNERRRLTGTIRLALALARSACERLTVEQCARLVSVFASSIGDAEVADRLCRALAAPGRLVSPTLFHNSVHNAPAGYWAIATGNRAASTSVANGEGTAAAGLLEAATRVASDAQRVLLVAYDMLPPPPLAASIDIKHSFGVGLLMAPGESTSDGWPLRLTLTAEAETAMPPPWEALRAGNPAARLLPVLAILARGEGRGVLGGAGGRGLAVEIEHAA